MLHKAISNLKNQDGEGEGGFTLIELLVVILIIGILAAIALPTFLGQSDKAKDSSAKSDARNMVSQVESCYTTTSNYTDCDANDAALDKGGIEGTVTVNGSNDGYSVVANSKTNNTFTITKSATGVVRTCSTSSSGSTKGGCPASGSW